MRARSALYLTPVHGKLFFKVSHTQNTDPPPTSLGPYPQTSWLDTRTHVESHKH